jgi:hypothetical protein
LNDWGKVALEILLYKMKILSAQGAAPVMSIKKS